nr:immunoglobulin light chain junction region [Macaca mulatta]MOY08684.1 immunoglobulin light chain junction region [Macaca mulatta]
DYYCLSYDSGLSAQLF